ncbi:hypothetical protein MRB53_007553 [Persea americana]|uniref:Uncharacterized protein n=1 Tax=Persea americana TaxID=3435 RepID=A0ACC2MJB0_PERAE|nr:hypothetical protein MRB53_007553 [Persea americana]
MSGVGEWEVPRGGSRGEGGQGEGAVAGETEETLWRGELRGPGGFTGGGSCEETLEDGDLEAQKRVLERLSAQPYERTCQLAAVDLL